MIKASNIAQKIVYHKTFGVFIFLDPFQVEIGKLYRSGPSSIFRVLS